MIYSRQILLWASIQCSYVLAGPSNDALTRNFISTSSTAVTSPDPAVASSSTLLASTSSTSIVSSSSSTSSIPLSSTTSTTSTDIPSQQSSTPTLSQPITTPSGFTSAAVKWSALSPPTLPAQITSTPESTLTSSPSSDLTTSAISAQSKSDALGFGSTSASQTDTVTASSLSSDSTTSAASSPVEPSALDSASTFLIPTNTPPATTNEASTLGVAPSAAGTWTSTLSPWPSSGRNSTAFPNAGSTISTNNSIQITPSSSHSLPSTSQYAQFTNSTTKAAKSHSPKPTFHNHTRTTEILSCTTLSPGEPVTVWSILPNPTTVTITVIGNLTSSYPLTPEFTPPVYCPTTTTTVSTGGSYHKSTSLLSVSSTLVGAGQSTTLIPADFTSVFALSPVRTTTIITTSKNPVTDYTTTSPLTFPGGDVKSDKQTVPPSGFTSASVKWSALPPPPLPGQATSTAAVTGGSSGGSSGSSSGGSNGGSSPGQTGNVGASPTTAIVSGVSVVVTPSQVVIGGQTVQNGGGSTAVITESGQTFTVNPSQVIAPGTVIEIPSNAGGIFMATPTPTVISGVSIQLGSSVAVIAGTTYAIGQGAPQETIVVNQQTISIGPGGLGFAQTTVTPPPSQPTNVVILDGEVFSAVGSSVAVIGDETFTYGPGSPVETDTFNGEAITIGPSGIELAGTTLGGAANPSGTQLGIAGGLSVTEIGASVAVINGITLTIGPGATPTTAVINGKTISAGPSGLGFDITTLSYPFNPTTQAVTAGGITFSEVGPSLVVIGGSTFTYGIGASQTTDVYNGQTISIGPSGIEFATTTVKASTATHTSKKNGVGRLRPVCGVVGICIAICIGYLI